MKANASEPLMKGRKRLLDGVKTGGLLDSGRSDGADLLTTVVAPGLKAARARIGLRHGTLEPVVWMQRERHKRKTREAESTKMEAQPPKPDTGAERPVVAKIGRNGPGQQGQALRREGVVSSSAQTPGQSRLVGRGAYG